MQGALTTSLQTTYPTAAVSGTSVANASPSTSSATPASSCFAGGEMVMLEEGGMKPISEVVIGQSIRPLTCQCQSFIQSLSICIVLN